MAGFVGIPIAMGIAILKYRLYEIDTLINRTLVYGALTALLAAGYVATIMVLQGIGDLVFQLPFRAVFGQKSTFATIAATLAMAALFNPLRRRIQSFIDRRFYRRKYDARKTLEAFCLLVPVAQRIRPRGVERRLGGSGKGDDAARTRLAVVAP